MTEEPFSNTRPLTFGESARSRVLFDRIAFRIKHRAAEQGKPMTDQEAIIAARNWLGYAELALEVAGRLQREEQEKETSGQTLPADN